MFSFCEKYPAKVSKITTTGVQLQSDAYIVFYLNQTITLIFNVFGFKCERDVLNFNYNEQAANRMLRFGWQQNLGIAGSKEDALSNWLITIGNCL